MESKTDRDRQFEEKIGGLLDALFGAALRLAKNRDDAEDLVAEAVSKAWANRNQLEDPDRFRPWIFRILTHTFISDCRKGSRKMETVSMDEGCSDEVDSFSLFEELHEPILFWGRTPEKDFLNKLLREDLQKAVDSLPEVFRIVVILSELEGFRYEEMAKILRLPIGTIRSRLARGRKLLQKALWNHGMDADLVRSKKIKQEKIR
jgi:RNA polymerase sigma-70 factor (ECF subfamily)